MIVLAMPVGSSHGWGICGKYITREMAALTGGNVRIACQPFNVDTVADELEFQAINALRFGPQDAAGTQVVNGVSRIPHPLLSCVVDKTFKPWQPALRGPFTLGYTFFEENLLTPQWINNARTYFDRISTGSSWCTQVLRDYGLTNTETVIQGVDPRVFFPWPDNAPPAREFLRDRFVIFSGGKFELRKGQDVVIRAVKAMQDRHPDVVLVNSWFNPWPQSMDTMRGSKLLRWPALAANGGAYLDSMTRILAENGMDLNRVVILAPRANALMARIYRNTDVGIFPNRCEGGTNLVLMEYMACGKPVVAVASTGHSDVVRPDNAVPVAIKGEMTINDGSGPVAKWPEPDLDDAIAKLEWVYQHRTEAAALGRKAGQDMATCTWTEAAKGFLKLLG
jgi:glycosyltransferase involved in cell wall biosynthesis